MSLSPTSSTRMNTNWCYRWQNKSIIDHMCYTSSLGLSLSLWLIWAAFFFNKYPISPTTQTIPISPFLLCLGLVWAASFLFDILPYWSPESWINKKLTFENAFKLFFFFYQEVSRTAWSSQLISNVTIYNLNGLT